MGQEDNWSWAASEDVGPLWRQRKLVISMHHLLIINLYWNHPIWNIYRSVEKYFHDETWKVQQYIVQLDSRGNAFCQTLSTNNGFRCSLVTCPAKSMLPSNLIKFLNNSLLDYTYICVWLLCNNYKIKNSKIFCKLYYIQCNTRSVWWGFEIHLIN